MAVKISGLKPIIVSPATLYLAGDSGTLVPHKFDVHFKRLTTDERDKLHARYTLGEVVPQPALDGVEQPPVNVPPLTDGQLLDELVEGWGGMLDEAGQPVPYSHAERKATDAVYAGLEQAMVVSWYDHAFINQRDARVKNSKAPSSTTSA